MKLMSRSAVSRWQLTRSVNQLLRPETIWMPSSPVRLIERLRHHPRDFVVVERRRIAGENVRAERGDDFVRRGGRREDDDAARRAVSVAPLVRTRRSARTPVSGSVTTTSTGPDRIRCSASDSPSQHSMPCFGGRSEVPELSEERLLPTDEENPGGREREDPGGRHGALACLSLPSPSFGNGRADHANRERPTVYCGGHEL